MDALERFRRLWLAYSHEGYCDRIVSAEYRRVLGEWLSAGRPCEIGRFIVLRANIGPDPVQ